MQRNLGQEWAYSELTEGLQGPTKKKTTGSCDLATFSNEIGVVVWSKDRTIEASSDVTISLQTPETGFCGMIGGALGLARTVASMVAVGSPLAGLLGTIGAICGVVGRWIGGGQSTKLRYESARESARRTVSKIESLGMYHVALSLYGFAIALFTNNVCYKA